MRLGVFIFALVFSTAAFAGSDKINFSFKNADLVAVVEDYAKAAQQKFIIDPNVHGKITIINHEPVTLTEAFSQLSSALALNSCAISKQDDVMIVNQSRAIQRDLIGMGTELPPLRPEQMYTLIINLKNLSADKVNRELRILTSKDGELVPYTESNQIIVTDWVSNLYRIQTLLNNIEAHVPKENAAAGGAASASAKTGTSRKTH